MIENNNYVRQQMYSVTMCSMDATMIVDLPVAKCSDDECGSDDKNNEIAMTAAMPICLHNA